MLDLNYQYVNWLDNEQGVIENYLSKNHQEISLWKNPVK